MPDEHANDMLQTQNTEPQLSLILSDLVPTDIFPDPSELIILASELARAYQEDSHEVVPLYPNLDDAITPFKLITNPYDRYVGLKIFPRSRRFDYYPELKENSIDIYLRNSVSPHDPIQLSVESTDTRGEYSMHSFSLKKGLDGLPSWEQISVAPCAENTGNLAYRRLTEAVWLLLP